MPKAIIFDLNGIFLESEYLSERIERKYGVSGDSFLKILDEVLEIARRPGCEDSFSLWEPKLKDLGINISKKDFFGFWFSGEKLVSGLLDYVKELRKKNIKIFVLSNNFKERTEYYRKSFPEMFKNIDKAYFSWETGFVKPDKRAYQKALDENGIKPEDCIYFDDSAENIQAASSLGIKSYLYQGLEKTKKIINNSKYQNLCSKVF